MNRKWSQRSLGNLKDIHPDLRRVMDRALQESPVDFVVIEGLRTIERQRELVASGASRTLNSRHLTGHAVDLLPIDPTDGKGKFDWPLYHKLAPAVKKASQSEGVSIVWGGDWSTFKDGPHFELERHSYPADADWPTATPVTPKPVDASPAPVGERQSPWAALLAWLLGLFRNTQ